MLAWLKQSVYYNGNPHESGDHFFLTYSDSIEVCLVDVVSYPLREKVVAVHEIL